MLNRHVTDFEFEKMLNLYRTLDFNKILKNTISSGEMICDPFVNTEIY